MQEISWQRWLTTFVILILLGLAADYFFLHVLFEQKRLNGVSEMAPTSPVDTDAQAEDLREALAHKGTRVAPDGDPSDPAEAAPSAAALPGGGLANDAANEEGVDNFLKSLQVCRGDISAQGIATPEALSAYLEKSVGVNSRVKDLENFHITLADGTERRLHFIPADAANADSTKGMELRYFKVDGEGFPERIPLKPNESLNPTPAFVDSLLKQGKLKLHQVKSIANLKDGATLILETHNDKVYEFQLRGPVGSSDQTLSCRRLNCQCK